MKEYNLIKEFYGVQKAKRSGVLLMNHIDEGLKILSQININFGKFLTSLKCTYHINGTIYIHSLGSHDGLNLSIIPKTIISKGKKRELVTHDGDQFF